MKIEDLNKEKEEKLKAISDAMREEIVEFLIISNFIETCEKILAKHW